MRAIPEPRLSLPTTVDAVIVGGGHHGLVAATTLADAGWDVLLLEARNHVGGAISSVDRDGWVMDEFSACHPLAVVSPIIKALELERHGLRWCRSDAVLAHAGSPHDTGGAAIMADAQATADLLGQDHPADARAWLDLVEEWQRIVDPLLDALLTRWPPLASGARLVRAIGGQDLPRFLRFLMLPTMRMGEELFRGPTGRMLLAGNAMHADIPPDAPGSGAFGWLMAMLAQDVGFPSPKGGAGQLAEALAARARQAGVAISVGEPVVHIEVRSGRAHAVHTADGRVIRARRAIIADTSAPALFGRLLDPSAVTARLRGQLDQFSWDLPTVKLNYRLAATVPWTAQRARSAGVVHVGADTAGLVHWSADLSTGRIPEKPFALVGQMSTIDPSRSPAGTQAMWVYTHLPRGVSDDTSAAHLVDRSEAMLDAFAPGWRDLVLDRWLQYPSDLEGADANLGAGAVGGGTAQLFQQLMFRPFTAMGGPRTHLENLYIGSAAIHPGGGVHGACGFLAARAAMVDHRWWGRPRRDLTLGVLHRLYGRNQ